VLLAAGGCDVIMPVVVMHGTGSGGYIGAGKNARPDSHLCLSIVAALFNPIFGLDRSVHCLDPVLFICSVFVYDSL